MTDMFSSSDIDFVSELYQLTPQADFASKLMEKTEHYWSGSSSAYVWYDGAQSQLMQSNTEESVQRLYNEVLYKDDLWFERAGAIRVGEVATGMRLAQLEEFNRDYLHEILLRSNCIDGLCFKIGSHDDIGSFLSIYRNESIGMYSDEDFKLANLMSRHIANVVELHNSVSSLARAKERGSRAAYEIDQVIIVVDRHARTRWCSRRGEAAIRDGHFVSSAFGHIHVNMNGRAVSLEPYLKALSLTGGSMLPIHDQMGSLQSILRIKAVEDQTREMIGLNLGARTSSQQYLLTFKTLNLDMTDVMKMLGDVYDLTRREAEACYFVATGMSSRDVCAQMDISTETLRSHIKHSMSKMSVQSKSEIVRIVNAVSV